MSIRMANRGRSPRVAAAFAVILGAVALSACGSGNSGGSGGDGSGSGAATGKIYADLKPVISGLQQSMVDDACHDGQLDMYQIGVTPSATKVVANFKRAVPCVKVNIVQAAGGELAQRFESGRRLGNVPDLFENSDPGLMEKLANDQAFLNFTPPNADGIDTPNPGLWYPEYGIPMGFLYRSDRVSAADAKKLTTWKSILDPAFRHYKINVVSPAGGGTGLTAFYDMQKTYGPSFFQQLAALHAQVFPVSRAAGEAIASGEDDLSFPFAETTALQLKDAGAPVRIAFTSPVDVIPVGSGIPKDAKHPAAAKLFLSYMLSPTVQKLYGTNNGALPVSPDVPFENKVTAESWWSLPKQRFQYQPLEVTNATKTIMDAFNSAFGS